MVKADRRKSCEFLRPWLEHFLLFVIDKGNIFDSKWIMDVPEVSNIKVFDYDTLSTEPEYKTYPESDDDDTMSNGRYNGGGEGYIVDINFEDM